MTHARADFDRSRDLHQTCVLLCHRSGSANISDSSTAEASAVPHNMAQQPTDTILYTFSARAPIKPGVVTILPYAATAAPDVDHNAKLTITRQFYDEYVL